MPHFEAASVEAVILQSAPALSTYAPAAEWCGWLLRFQAPMVKVTRKVSSMAATSVPLVVIECCVVMASSPQDCLGGECTWNHRNAAYNVKGLARGSDGRRKQLHCDPDCHRSDEERCLEAPIFSQGEARCSRPPQFRPCREYRTDETTPRLVIVYYENAGSLRYR
jgi:hypothetical protein